MTLSVYHQKLQTIHSNLHLLKDIEDEDGKISFFKPFKNSNNGKIEKFVSICIDESGKFTGITAMPLKNTDIRSLIRKNKKVVFSGGEKRPTSLKEIISDNQNEVNSNKDEINKKEREANFKEWFGDSKVVDENGEPLVVYHGTGADFNEFKLDDNGLAFFGTEKALQKILEI